jgi:hypothetical protein
MRDLHAKLSEELLSGPLARFATLLGLLLLGSHESRFASFADPYPQSHVLRADACALGELLLR